MAKTNVKAQETTTTETKPMKEKKISVIRFLQDNPQEDWVELLMKTNYPLQFNTVARWGELVDYTIHKKYRSL